LDFFPTAKINSPKLFSLFWAEFRSPKTLIGYYLGRCLRQALM